jgi:hypothetical protein
MIDKVRKLPETGSNTPTSNYETYCAFLSYAPRTEALNKQLIILTLLCLFGISSPAQYYWEWARRGATNSEAFGTELVSNPVDGGQTYAGNFRAAEITFQPASFVTLPNPGSDPDSYVIHLDSDGLPLWSFYIGKTGNVCHY